MSDGKKWETKSTTTSLDWFWPLALGQVEPETVAKLIAKREQRMVLELLQSSLPQKRAKKR